MGTLPVCFYSNIIEMAMLLKSKAPTKQISDDKATKIRSCPFCFMEYVKAWSNKGSNKKGNKRQFQSICSKQEQKTFVPVKCNLVVGFTGLMNKYEVHI